jgi:hypothetical protein
MLVKKEEDDENPTIYQIYIFGTHNHEQIDESNRKNQQQRPQSQCSSAVTKKTMSEKRVTNLARKTPILTPTKAKRNLDETNQSQDKLIDGKNMGKN